MDVFKKNSWPDKLAAGIMKTSNKTAAFKPLNRWGVKTTIGGMAKGTTKGIFKAGVGGIKGIAKAATSRGGIAGIVGLGAVAMMGMGLMRGMNNQARDIMYDRYMKDTRYSKSMAANTMVGQASNRNSMLNRMSATGSLGLSLSKSRHGRY